MGLWTIEEVTAKVEELRTALEVLYSEKMQELQEMKAHVSASLEEVERTLAEEQPPLTTKFAPHIRHCTEHSAPLHLFTCSVSSSPALLQLTLQPTTLAGVWCNTAFLYEVQSQQLTKHTLSVNFGYGGSYIECDKDTLLCVGGFPASSKVYSLNLSSFQLTSLPSLSTPRSSPGLAKVNTQFYAFGGYADPTSLSSCEKMQLSDKRWTPISSMNHPRAYFTPCHFRALLYLVSPATTKAVETFNPEKQSFTVLPVSLPPDLRDRRSVAFIANEELCVLTNDKQMVRWKIDCEREFRLSNTTQDSWSNQQPLIVGSLVLIACKGAVQRFSLETYSFLA